MSLVFRVVGNIRLSDKQDKNTIYLHKDNWDDFGYSTLFSMVVFDEFGNQTEIGNVKIGYRGEPTGGYTYSKLPDEFSHLEEGFFSLGQGVEYYKSIVDNLSEEFAKKLLIAICDVVLNPNCLTTAEKEDVFHTSLLRNVSISSIHKQFKRVLDGDAILTEYHFAYEKDEDDKYSGIELDFHVEPDSKPHSNIHTIIGRNGIGKTTLLNNMISSIIDNKKGAAEVGAFYDLLKLDEPRIDRDYFSSVISVAFSAFDPFTPPKDQPHRAKGTCFYYIGLKLNNDNEEPSMLKHITDLHDEFVSSLAVCFSIRSKKQRWVSAIRTLESDTNFAEIDLCRLAELKREGEVKKSAKKLVSLMSSGHTIVLLTITKLIETVEEKTLVLIDEPESHLHPPLLSAFTRALSNLLINRNAVAIVATHSPVVLQEVPKSCVWKLERSKLEGKSYRLESETFGENSGVLTREVFGLEVDKSGFHDLLKKSVSAGHSYEAILKEYKGQIGFEGKAILRALISSASNNNGN